MFDDWWWLIDDGDGDGDGNGDVGTLLLKPHDCGLQASSC